MMNATRMPQNGPVENRIWLRVAPSCCAELTYSTMLTP